MVSQSSGAVWDRNIPSNALEVAYHAQIWKVLLTPHDREGLGMVAGGWRSVEANKDTCPCSLMLKSDALQLEPTVTTDSAQEAVGSQQTQMQDAMKVDTTVPLPRLEE